MNIQRTLKFEGGEARWRPHRQNQDLHLRPRHARNAN